MIIFLCGPKGSGKDTVASKFIELHPTYIRLAFADPIRDFVMDLFDLTTTTEYDDFKRGSLSVNSNCVSGREIVRGIGMKMLSYDTEQFVRYVEEQINQSTNNVIVTDTRMDHEFNLVTKLRQTRDDVVLAQIRRPGHEYDGHVTERPPSVPVDLVINNDGNVNDAVLKLHFYTTGETNR